MCFAERSGFGLNALLGRRRWRPRNDDHWSDLHTKLDSKNSVAGGASPGRITARAPFAGAVTTVHALPARSLSVMPQSDLTPASDAVPMLMEATLKSLRITASLANSPGRGRAKVRSTLSDPISCPDSVIVGTPRTVQTVPSSQISSRCQVQSDDCAAGHAMRDSSLPQQLAKSLLVSPASLIGRYMRPNTRIKPRREAASA